MLPVWDVERDHGRDHRGHGAYRPAAGHLLPQHAVSGAVGLVGRGEALGASAETSAALTRAHTEMAATVSDLRDGWRFYALEALRTDSAVFTETPFTPPPASALESGEYAERVREHCRALAEELDAAGAPVGGVSASPSA